MINANPGGDESFQNDQERSSTLIDDSINARYIYLYYGTTRVGIILIILFMFG